MSFPFDILCVLSSFFNRVFYFSSGYFGEDRVGLYIFGVVCRNIGEGVLCVWSRLEFASVLDG